MSDQQLEINLAPQIIEAYRESNRLALEAKGVASEAVAKAIECGQLLLEQKAALKHGGWLDWLDANLSDIDERTARRYMALAKRTHVTDLNDTATIRQAYLATGIIPTPTHTGTTTLNPDKPWVKYVRWIDGFRLWFNKRIEEGDIDTWPENSRRVLKNDLKWIADLYARL